MKKRDFFKNLSLTGLACLLPDISSASQSSNLIPSAEVLTKWYPILAYSDTTINSLVKLETATPLKDATYIYDYSFYIPKEQVYECATEMENFETKCSALQETNPELVMKIVKLLRMGIPSIRRRYGKSADMEDYPFCPLILFKEVNKKGILVNLENSKRDDLFISWNAWIFDQDISSITSMPYDTVFLDYIVDEQYRLTRLTTVV